MKFSLTYDGSLPPSANKSRPDDVWRIRQAFHPQLVDLWESHPALKSAIAQFPRFGSGVVMHGHHLHSPEATGVSYRHEGNNEIINLNDPIDRHGMKFRPLVRKNYALHCGLQVLFLRKEAPGKVYQGGDLDGRIKTLLDGLSMPQHIEQIRKQSDDPDPMHVLMEDDSMLSGLEVESERLLTDQNHPKDYVRLVVKVDVRVEQATTYNQSFLG